MELLELILVGKKLIYINIVLLVKEKGSFDFSLLSPNIKYVKETLNVSFFVII